MINDFYKRLWQLKEFPFHPHDLPHTETIYTIGNGLVGARGSFEEGYPKDTSTTLCAGIFDHKAGELVPELVGMPNWLSLTLSINGDVFRLDEGKILGYERILDLKTAILYRNVLWLSPQNIILQLAFERFASLHNPHLLALQLRVKVVSEGEHQLSIASALDNTVLNPNEIDHWGDVAGKVDNDRLYFDGQTKQSAYDISMAAQTLIDRDYMPWINTSNGRQIEHQTSLDIGYRERVTITKLVTLYTNRDGESPSELSSDALIQAVDVGYDALKSNHISAWDDYWAHLDIVIEGDEVAQRAVRFCTYQVLIATPRHEERVSIAAKTLSGFGYKGHVFWDTELFMVPPLTLSYPSLAKNLLMYRYHNLHGARNKAREAGHKGAMFPWESTDTGEETTPRYANETDLAGNRVRIWMGDNEQHISTDIAYAVLQYWRWTGDDDWFVKYGAEIVLDTAKFWGSRVQFNEDHEYYELRMQIGPDEYHENVDNIAFTNRMVVWHLGQAQAVVDWLKINHPTDFQRLSDTLHISDSDLELWGEIAKKMLIPFSDVGGGVYEQFEGFFDLPTLDLEDYTPRITNMNLILGYEKSEQTRVIKQADVVMLMALLGDELGDKAFLRRNWDVYSQIVDHGSSLSPAIHAWVAARLGLPEIAYDLFIYGATIDIDDHKGNVRDGIHGASCGGTWQAVVFGFCGLQLTDDGIKTNPCLPDHWRRVSFKVMVKGEPVEIVVENIH